MDKTVVSCKKWLTTDGQQHMFYVFTVRIHFSTGELHLTKLREKQAVQHNCI